MSEQQCNSGTIGFPLRLNRNIFDPNWLNASQPERQKLISPIDFEVNWAPPSNVTITTLTDLSRFQVNGLDNYASSTTITYGVGSDFVRYTLLPTMSLTKVQHGTLVNQYGTSPTQEVIVAFTIDPSKKVSNPSAPDVILMCRPLILQSGANPNGSLWKAINDSAKSADGNGNGSRQTLAVDLSSIYTYGGREQIIQPMMTYETCVPTQFMGGGKVSKAGSILVRVHVVTNPLTIMSDTAGTGKCTNINGYVFPGSVARLISFQGYTGIQFSTGMEADGSGYMFPSGSNPQLTPLVTSSTVDNWEDVLKKVEYLIPEAFLGKSLAEIANAPAIPVKAKVKKQYKCYTIDPKKDIVDGQIMIDPSTGESIQDTLRQDALDSSGGDPALAAALAGNAAGQSGIMPGDVEAGIFIALSSLGALCLVGYFFYVLRLFLDATPGRFNHLVYLILAVGILLGIIIGMAKDLDNKGVKV